MKVPRVFTAVDDKLVEVTSWPELKGERANILVVCGQGVYEEGIYYGEFHDRDVYFEHAITIPSVLRKFSYNCVVFSGGFTQVSTPWTSEAESFTRMMNDADAVRHLPASVPCVLDEAALDSADNLLLGLMTARLAIGQKPIGRVGIYAAWKFKKWRFNRSAQALGIVERTYFHGLASAPETNVEVPLEDRTQKTLAEYLREEEEYRLLRTDQKRKKRQQRWRNNRDDPQRDSSLVSEDLHNLRNTGLWKYQSKTCQTCGQAADDPSPFMTYDSKPVSYYSNRLSHLHEFTRTLASLEKIAGGAEVKETRLWNAFKAEVIL